MNEMENLQCIGYEISKLSNNHMVKNLELEPSIVGRYCMEMLEQMILKFK